MARAAFVRAIVYFSGGITSKLQVWRIGGRRVCGRPRGKTGLRARVVCDAESKKRDVRSFAGVYVTRIECKLIIAGNAIVELRCMR